MFAIENDIFDPVLLSLEENAFLLEHVGKPPAVVARVPIPVGVNVSAVLPIVEQVYALEEVQKHDHEPWTGLATLKQTIQTYLEQRASWAAMKARAGATFPTFPTMAAWNSQGKPSMGAVGSDSGRVRTYFDDDGNRQRLAVSLHDTGVGGFTPPWVKKAITYDGLVVDDEKGFVRCPICEKTETYDPAAQSTRNLAQGRMAKHLTSSKTQPDAHKALHTKVFG